MENLKDFDALIGLRITFIHQAGLYTQKCQTSRDERSRKAIDDRATCTYKMCRPAEVLLHELKYE